jgi:hypothetical protein
MKRTDFMSTPMAMTNGCGGKSSGGKNASTKPASKQTTKKGTKRGK